MAPEFAPAVLVGRRAIIGGKVTIECGHDAEELVFLRLFIFLRGSSIWKVAPLPGASRRSAWRWRARGWFRPLPWQGNCRRRFSRPFSRAARSVSILSRGDTF